MAAILMSLLSLCNQIGIDKSGNASFCRDFMTKCVTEQFDRQEGDVSNVCFKKYIDYKKWHPNE